MNISLVISVSEVDFLCVWRSEPSDLTTKGFVIRSLIFDFVNNSTFLEQLRRKLTLLLLFLIVLLDLGVAWHFRRFGCGIVLTIHVCVSLQVHRLLHDRLYKRLQLCWSRSWEVLLG